MWKNVISLILISASVFSACTAQKKTVGATKTHDIRYIKMSRTSCFGRCPVYDLELYANGLVRYTGRLFVVDSGVFTNNIGEEKAGELIKEFTDRRVDTLQHEYEIVISDLPGVNFSFGFGDTLYPVRNATFGPPFLQLLARKMDSTLLVKDDDGEIRIGRGWKKINDSPRPN